MNGLLWERRDDDEMIDRENRPGTPLTKYSVFPQQIKSSPHCSLAPFVFRMTPQEEIWVKNWKLRSRKTTEGKKKRLTSCRVTEIMNLLKLPSE
jgi:hypothetical protein